MSPCPRCYDAREKPIGRGGWVGLLTTAQRFSPNSDYPTLSKSGRYLVFRSLSSNFDPRDTLINADLYVYDTTDKSLIVVSDPTNTTARKWAPATLPADEARWGIDVWD